MFKKNNSGQSIFEFMIFLPLMLILYSGLMSFGNSINGSINQQKIARSYFFSKTKGNSMVPRTDDLAGKNWQSVGMFFIGWAESLSGGSVIGNPLAPCYKVQSFGADPTADKCNESYNKETTQFIRPMTVFGLCTTTYYQQNQNWIPSPPMGASYDGCIIK